MDTDRDFADAFDAAFAALRDVVEAACPVGAPWPARAAAAIAATLEFAAARPASARALTSDAFANGLYGGMRHRQMVGYFATMLEEGRREPSAVAADLPGVTERALIGGFAEIVAERLHSGHEAALPNLAGELIELTLTPYLGSEEAKRLARRVPLP